MSVLKHLRARGFDRSEAVPFTGAAWARCSQCEALVINGIATHETGCVNTKHECKGCYTLISVRETYCEDCR